MPAFMKTSAVSGYFWTTSRMLISFVIAIVKNLLTKPAKNLWMAAMPHTPMGYFHPVCISIIS